MGGLQEELLIDLLKFGFPLGHNGRTGSSEIPKNHTGARFYPVEINRILKKEIATKATIGPFRAPPFENYCLSPLNSVPKKGSSQRRLILDLSMPDKNAINDGIDKDSYLGIVEKLSLPSIDALADRVMRLGRNCKLFKVDLTRAYRQIFLCPSSIAKVGFYFEEMFYYDCSLSMGSRSSAKCCQKVSGLVVLLFNKQGYFAINYLDDLGSAEEAEKAAEAYHTLRELLRRMGLQEAVDKSCPPSTVMIFLGIEVNSVMLTLTIPKEKWDEVKLLLRNWMSKEKATLKEVQSLAGSLNFVCRCVKSGRIYLAHILNFLRSMPKFAKVAVPEEVRLDIPVVAGICPVVQWCFSDAGGGVVNSRQSDEY